MAIMGSIWWIYGIGMQGEAPSWHVVEYNAGDVEAAVTERVRDLELADLPQDDDGVDYETMATTADENPEAIAELNQPIQKDGNAWLWLTAPDPDRGEGDANAKA